jgi:hypothetical protein
VVLVVASGFDSAAQALVARWRGEGARLLTPSGLSRPGWIFDPERPERSVAIIEDEVIQLGDIRGVCTRLGAVTTGDLAHVVPEERAYVAAEMTAFLLAWLSAMSCPVVNRPTPLNLAGPSWRSDQWARAAARAGLVTHPVRRRVPPYDAASSSKSEGSDEFAAEPSMSVSLIGARMFVDGADPQEGCAVEAKLRAIAAEAGVDALTAIFSRAASGLVFRHASASVDVTRSEVADALQALLLERA